MKQIPSSEQITLEEIKQKPDTINKNPEEVSQWLKTQNNRNPLYKALITTGNIVLIFTAVFCTFGALISAFSIPVSISALFWFWLFNAVVLSIILTLYRIKGLPAFIVPALILLYVNLTEIIDGGMWVINKITDTYSNWLQITALFPEAKSFYFEPFLFLAAAGVLFILLLAITICLRRSLFGTVLLTAPIVFLTFVITDTQSDLGYLFGLIAVYLTLLVSSALAPDDYIKRGLVTFPAFAVSLIFMFIVYLLSPYNGYIRNNHIITMGNNFRTFSAQMGRFGQLWQGPNYGISWAGSSSGGVWQFNTNSVNITNAGRRYITNKNLLEINVDRPGTFYLRGYSMGDFDGSSWGKDPVNMPLFTFDHDSSISAFNELARKMPAEIAFSFRNIDPDDAPTLSRMDIRRTGDLTADISYQPYYSYMSSSVVDELDAVENFFYINSVHSLVERIISQGYPMPGLNNEQYSEWMNELYTTIDEDTAQELRRLARDAGINQYAQRYAVVDAVARYVLSSGRYTLTPERIPGDIDFAVYFFEESNEGYCIHFATAAVLMLRSLDIPARFTSGYVVTVPSSEAGRTVELTDENAHAWVEVFYDDIGWLYLEVTPSAGNTYVPQPRPHTPPVINTPQPETTPAPTPNPNDTQRPPERPGLDENGGGGTNGNVNREQNLLQLPSWLYNIIQFVFLVIVIVLIFVLRRNAMNKIRKKRFEQANTNTAVICIWRYILKLGRKEAVPPKNIEELALKARFSQHRITEEERKEILGYATRLAYEIYNGKENEFGRLWLRYIRALC